MSDYIYACISYEYILYWYSNYTKPRPFSKGKMALNMKRLRLNWYCLWWIYAWWSWKACFEQKKNEIGVTKNHYVKLLKLWETGRIPFLLWFFPAQYESMYDRIIYCKSVCYTILTTNVHACHQLHKMNWAKYYFHIIWQPGSKVLFTCLWLCHQ